MMQIQIGIMVVVNFSVHILKKLLAVIVYIVDSAVYRILDWAIVPTG